MEIIRFYLISNEGTEVMIKQNQKNWIEIILLDGKRAWITSNKIRLLWN